MAWIKITRNELPAGIRFDHATGRDAGQIVDVQYGFFGSDGPAASDAPYKRVHDQSEGPGAVEYYRRARS